MMLNGKMVMIDTEIQIVVYLSVGVCNDSEIVTVTSQPLAITYRAPEACFLIWPGLPNSGLMCGG